MDRKWIVTVCIVALTLSVVMFGCSKKKPEAPVEMAVEETVAPAEEVAPPPAPPIEDETPPLMSEDLRIVNEYAKEQGLLGDVYYDFDKYDLKPEALERLAKNAAFMKEHPEFTFSIEGHCDERGTNEYNLALGDRRANAGSGYLTSLGVSASRFQTISYGEERPVCMESNEGCWWRNRRAHFLITGRS